MKAVELDGTASLGSCSAVSAANALAMLILSSYFAA